MKHRDKSPFCLIPLDNEGEWNRPLLENAAAISGADCIFSSTDEKSADPTVCSQPLNDILEGFRHIVACEIVRDSVNIFDFPAPRERTAVLVGNEINGIPRSVLKRADKVVSIPMIGSGMSSVNVAVSAAIILYVLSKDLGRTKRVQSGLARRDVDILINAPNDPHEVGSLLRSAWSFGWRRAFLSDPNGVWFTKDKSTVLDGRAAARRHKNPIVVLPAADLDPESYDNVVVCDDRREGQQLSRFQVPDGQNLLIVYGNDCGGLSLPMVAERIFVDFADNRTAACFRHQGSVLLSFISTLLKT